MDQTALLTGLNEEVIPTTISVASGSGQVALINTGFANPLKALVEDQSGNPMEGIEVTFTAPTEGASGLFTDTNTATATTDENGVATAPAFTANGTAGEYVVEASVSGISSPAQFQLENVLPVATTIEVSSGSSQNTRVNTPFADPLKALVRDQFGNPMADVTVSFTAPTEGASGLFTDTNAAEAASGADGIATAPTFTANGIDGEYTVEATVSGISSPVQFQLENIALTASTVEVSSGSSQNARVNTPFADPLKALVKDQFGDPLVGVTVTFTAPTEGASGLFTDTNVATATTDADGIAIAPTFTANGEAGSYLVQATAAGIATSAEFQLSNSTGILYVSATGSDSNNCLTPLVPCLTINAAIGKAAPGDEIHAASGTYTGSGSSVVTIDKSVSILGGWDADFASQTGYTTIDAQGSWRRGIQVNSGVSAELTRLIVTSGHSSDSGAGIYNLGTLTVTNLSIGYNQSLGFGGGIFNGGTLLIRQSAIYDNDSEGGFGGGIYNTGALTVINTTIAENSALDGGGIFYSILDNTGTPPTMLLKNVTISGNRARSRSAGIDTDNTSVQTPVLINTILAGNWGGGDLNCLGTYDAQGANIIVPNSHCTVTGAYTNTDPLLAPFSYELEIYLPSRNSPAIDAGSNGDCESPDQLGTLRPLDGNGDALAVCDIGAYERDPSTLSVATTIWGSSGSSQTAKVNQPFASPFKALVRDQFNDPLAGVTVTFTAPASGASGLFTDTNVATAITDENGIATAPAFTANSETGIYIVQATASGIAFPTGFQLTNWSGMWYVSPGGYDYYNCKSPSTPCLTINGAIGKADSGGTIYAASGTYTGSGTAVVTINKSVSILGGWDSGFASQTGYTTIDAQNSRKGIHVNSGVSTELTRLIVTNGHASSGAGINNLGVLTITNLSIKSNYSDGTLGGSGIFNGGNLLIRQSAIHDNGNGYGSGGGIYNTGALTVIDTTIAKNSALYGGGVYYSITGNTGTPPTLLFKNVTISGNSANYGGGIYTANTSVQTPVLINSIMAGNTALNTYPNCFGTHDAQAANIIVLNSGCTVTGTYTNADPLLGPFSTALEAYPLRLASPALDTGSNAECESPDQLGTIRPLDGDSNGLAVCDIGAYERDPAILSVINTVEVSSGSGQSARTGQPFASPLKAIVKGQFGDPLVGVTVTFTAPASGASGLFTDTNTTTAITDADGIATAPTFTANDSGGTYTVEAAVSGISSPAQFQLKNLQATTVVVSSGSSQTAMFNQPFTSPLKALVRDQFGNPLAGVTVTLTAPTEGASGLFTDTNIATAITDENGIATAPAFTANGEAGSYLVQATVSGIVTSADFQLTNWSGIWYVSPGGNDTNDCKAPSAACLTINGAIGKAAAGNVIRVASGTYTGSGTAVVTINKSVHILGGWDSGFASQTGYTTIDAQNSRKGIYVNSGVSAELTRMIIMNGNVSGGGAGIYNRGTLTITSLSIRNNHSTGGNGGAGIFNAGTLTIRQSTIYDNVSTSNGGGIFNTGALTVISTTIAKNDAFNGGGIIYSITGNAGIPPTLLFKNTTISGNSANYGGGLYTANTSVQTPVFINSILAGNTHRDAYPNCYGTHEARAANIIVLNSECTVTGTYTNTDPLLAAFSTELEIYPLHRTSPAVDTGSNADCESPDQLGTVRPLDGNNDALAVCDIGAYERDPSMLFATTIEVSSGSSQTARIGQPFASPLKALVKDQFGDPLAGVTVTFAAPASSASGTFTGSGASITTITDASGIATASTFSANSEAGSYTVQATVSGISGSAGFQLANWNGKLYVATNGSDANNCVTASTPCETINGAIGKAYNSDTIYVASGTYTSNSSEVISINKSIDLSGGWNSTFEIQSGMSTIDGQNIRRGMAVYRGVIATIERFIIQNGHTNSSANGGAGILNYGDLTIYSSSVSNNSTDDNRIGGGIYNDGTLSLSNTTIRNNTARYGGGIFNNGFQQTAINNSTISDNVAEYGGGIYSNSQANTTLENTVLSRNGINSVSGADCYGGEYITSNGHNLIGTNTGCNLVLNSGDMINIDPELGPYIPSWGFYPLIADSPAIDAGNSSACASFDQRGIVRPFDGDHDGTAICDIGAFEYTAAGTAAKLFIYDGNGQRAPLLFDFHTLFKVVILDADGDLVDGAEVVFSAPLTGPSGTFAKSAANTVTVYSDEAGIATAPVYTANNQSGSYLVNASLNGIGDSVNFSADNSPLWYVSPPSFGNNSNTCSTPQTPCATVNGVMTKAGFVPGDGILLTTGSYGAIAIYKNASLSGGWNTTFDKQIGYSIIDGQNSTRSVVTSAADVTINRLAIVNGWADDQGGGLLIWGTLKLNQSAVFNNASDEDGGGIYLDGGRLELTNSTVANNTAAVYGGGIVIDGGSTLVLNNATILNNQARIGNNIYFGVNEVSTLITQNSIIAGCERVDIFNSTRGVIISEGNNLIINNNHCRVPIALSDKVEIDPEIILFPDAYAALLAPTSPAIDAGNSATCSNVDQAGNARPVDGNGDHFAVCDIGAREFNVNGTIPAYLYPYPLGTHFIPPGGSDPKRFTLFVWDAMGNGVPGIDVTFTAPASGASGTFANDGTRITTSTTDAYGFATADVFTANNTLGNYHVEARITELSSPALFDATNACYTLTTDVIPDINGTVSATPSPNCLGNKYLPGTEVTLSAHPSTGYHFLEWSGDATSSINTIHITLNSDKYIAASFELNSYTITGNAGESGVTLRYTNGTAKSVTSASNGRYTITVPYNWSGSVTPSKTGLTFSPASKSYSHITANQANQNYYAVMTILSTGSYDGWVLESSETSSAGGSLDASATTFILGDNSLNRQYRALLAFNTASLPDTAVLQSVVVKIKQSGAPVGTSPFSVLGNLYADIRKGYFGTGISLQTTDFNAAASTTSVAATFGKTPVSAWYSAILTSTGRSYVNKTSWTQLRLRFSTDDNNNLVANYMRFYSGNYSNSSYRPQLIVTYTLP